MSSLFCAIQQHLPTRKKVAAREENI